MNPPCVLPKGFFLTVINVHFSMSLPSDLMRQNVVNCLWRIRYSAGSAKDASSLMCLDKLLLTTWINFSFWSTSLWQKAFGFYIIGTIMVKNDIFFAFWLVNLLEIDYTFNSLVCWWTEAVGVSALWDIAEIVSVMSFCFLPEIVSLGWHHCDRQGVSGTWALLLWD